jgi:hypothetical protein
MARALRYNFEPRFGAAGFSHIWQGNPQTFQAWIKRQAELYSTLSVGETVPDPASSRVEGGIDWRATDDEIIKKFKCFLKNSRPAQFEENANKPRLQRGYDNALPFRKGAALKWLGVYRRRKAVASWSEFFSLYPEENENVRKVKAALPVVNFPKQLAAGRLSLNESHLRARQADCRKAKLILEWFDVGTPLKREDFK